MVPKFCFPFDVERYGWKQTLKDPRTQTSQRPPGFKHPGTQGLRHSETPATKNLYTQSRRLVDRGLGVLGGGVRERGPSGL